MAVIDGSFDGQVLVDREDEQSVGDDLVDVPVIEVVASPRPVNESVADMLPVIGTEGVFVP